MTDLQQTAYALTMLGYDEDKVVATLANQFPDVSAAERERAVGDAAEDVRDTVADLMAEAAEDARAAVKAEHDLERSMHQRGGDHAA